MAAYYNELDPYAAQWLRNLIAAGHIAPGDVDERSIVDVRADDLAGYTQCHFFAGLGVWSYALRLAGWPDDRPVWTGSCPCQTHSSAARGRNVEPDWWPIWQELIVSNRPRVVFGEQVAAAVNWIDAVGDAMEALDYSFGAAVIPACSVGKDHARQRFYFVGHANGDSESGLPIYAQVAGLQRDQDHARDMVRPHGNPPRMAVLCAIGNSLVAPLAAEFIRAASARPMTSPG